MTTKLHESFLQLVRLGIGTSKGVTIPKDIDWEKLKALSDEQGLSAVVLDALNTDSVNLTENMPLQMKLEWIGEVLQSYEQRYNSYEKAINSLAGFYNQHGFKLMVLKGFTCSLDWPKPKHRPCGDIDIWQFGQQKEADSVLAKEQGIKIDKSHHHHTVFYWREFMVENHYDFLDTNTRKSSLVFEKVLKELGSDNSHSVDVNGEIVYLPSPNLHALFLIRHMVDHFTSVSISLRQLLDWAFFVEKHGNEVDWKWLIAFLEKNNIKDFFNCLNAICVDDLGFSVLSFPSVQFNPALKDRILNDILYPEFSEKEPEGFIRQMIYKYRRWQGNAWKQRLCYPESRFLSFFTGLRAHMIKPSIE